MTELGREKETEDVVSLYLEGCHDSQSTGEFSLPPGGWCRLLQLGRIYGWDPAGTEVPEYPWLDRVQAEDLGTYWIGTPSDWDGRYFPGYGEHVIVEDARALAAALVRALPDLPEHEAFERTAGNPEAQESSLQYMPYPKVDRQTSPFELYSGRYKEVLRWFITHCLECGGGFWIWSYEERDR